VTFSRSWIDFSQPIHDQSLVGALAVPGHLAKARLPPRSTGPRDCEGASYRSAYDGQISDGRKIASSLVPLNGGIANPGAFRSNGDGRRQKRVQRNQIAIPQACSCRHRRRASLSLNGQSGVQHLRVLLYRRRCRRRYQQHEPCPWLARLPRLSPAIFDQAFPRWPRARRGTAEPKGDRPVTANGGGHGP
jgi:hypothetical protein